MSFNLESRKDRRQLIVELDIYDCANYLGNLTGADGFRRGVRTRDERVGCPQGEISSAVQARAGLGDFRDVHRSHSAIARDAPRNITQRASHVCKIFASLFLRFKSRIRARVC
jgi:hypothetical protein